MKKRLFFIEPLPPSNQVLRGGSMICLKQIEGLNTAGIQAYLVQPPSAESRALAHIPKCSETDAYQNFNPRQDVWVINALNAARFQQYPGPKILFFQSALYAFIPYMADTSVPEYPWKNPDVKAIITVSPYHQSLIEFAKVDCPVYHLPLAPQADQFEFSKLAHRPPHFLSTGDIPEKNNLHLRSIVHLFYSRNPQLQNCILPLQNLPYEQVATYLSQRRALIFPPLYESWGLLPLEAMLSGCLPLAFDIPPLNTYLPQGCLFPYGDLPAMISALEDLSLPEIEPHWQTLADQCQKIALERVSLAKPGDQMAVWKHALQWGE